MPLPALFRALIGDRRGAGAIEFAVMGPIFFLVVAAVIETGFLFMGDMALESGARAASRYGLTGADVIGKTRPEVLRQLVTKRVCPAVLANGSSACLWAEDGPLSEDEHGSPTPLFLTAQAYQDVRNIGRGEPYSDGEPKNGAFDPGEAFTDVNGNGAWDANMGAVDPGGSGDIVVYEVGFYQKVFNPLLQAVVGRHLYHRTRMVIRNEPY